ncbi:ABC transporter substrate-binding protein [Cryptosporangium phraense]|uniref:Nitrate ABC transporter substrate-binding protein n=1 Tax=Cryptosporangium phraense TaxID=2593070 RepID=A0A545AHV8_9ACTN|nr:ABC transporter substrate-binding protein [Cryptosporangium phraense]TQS40902.1 nitrate ABC transporter substrate-binding protein [Cryptosporangium phraense]
MRRALASIAAATLALALAGCGGSSGPDVKTQGGNAQLTVGTIPIVDVAPIYLGKQKGFFTKRHIDLTLKTAAGGAAIVPSVMSGEYQVGFSNFTSLLLARDKGLPLTVVANGVSSTGVQGKDFGAIVVGKGSPAQTAKDLAGKRVAVNTLKNIGDTSVRASVRKAGGNPGSIKFVELPFPDMPAALAGGRVDAEFIVEPQLSQVLAAGARVLTSTFVDVAPNLSVAGWFVNEKLLKSDKGLVARFVEAIRESNAYADAHPDEVRQILSQYTKISADLAPKLTLPKWPAEINRTSVATVARLATDDKVLSKTPDLTALYAS